MCAHLSSCGEEDPACLINTASSQASCFRSKKKGHGQCEELIQLAVICGDTGYPGVYFRAVIFPLDL